MRSRGGGASVFVDSVALQALLPIASRHRGKDMVAAYKSVQIQIFPSQGLQIVRQNELIIGEYIQYLSVGVS